MEKEREQWLSGILNLGLKAREIALYVTLRKFMSKKTRQCYPAIKTIMKISGIKNYQTFKKARATLNLLGVISFKALQGNKTIYSLPVLSVEKVQKARRFKSEVGSICKSTRFKTQIAQGSKDEQELSLITKSITKSNKIEKKKFLEFVLLGEEEHKKLKARFGEQVTKEYIERLNNYIGSTGKKYESHYHTILTWLRDKPDKNTPKSSNNLSLICK